jgi:hypothetical protein
MVEIQGKDELGLGLSVNLRKVEESQGRVEERQ